MPFRAIAFLILFACSATACGQSLVERAEKDELYHAEDEDPNMQKAFASARQSLDGFLDIWRNPPAGAADFSVKVGIKEGNDTEYFWISPFREEKSGFKGALNNQPRLVSSVELGDEIAFSREQIVDWTYNNQGKMVGNHTACAMLLQESESERAAFEERYGLRCEA